MEFLSKTPEKCTGHEFGGKLLTHGATIKREAGFTVQVSKFIFKLLLFFKESTKIII